MNAPVLAAMLASILIQPAQSSSPDAEGFIRNWLVLAPIAVQEDSGATEIEKDFLGGESSIRAEAGRQSQRQRQDPDLDAAPDGRLFHRLPESIRQRSAARMSPAMPSPISMPTTR